MRKRFTDAFIAVVMGAAVTLTTRRNSPLVRAARQRPSPRPPPRGLGAVGWTVEERRQPHDRIESPAVRT